METMSEKFQVRMESGPKIIKQARDLASQEVVVERPNRSQEEY